MSKQNWNLQGKPVTVCPPDCPNRCSEPNCHNSATCEIWAAHEARQREIYAARDKKFKENLGSCARGRDFDA